jgi:hypothetical protein
MAKYEFDKDKFEEWKRAQKESLDLQEKMNSSISGYLESIKKIGELQKNIKFIEEKRNELANEYGKSAKDVRDNWKELIAAQKRGDAAEIAALKDKDKELRKILASKKEGVKILEHELNLIKKQHDILVESAKQANLISAGFGSTVGFLGKIPGLIGKGFGKLKGTGVFEMDKEIRNAVRSMAGGNKQYDNMFKTITKASDTTTMWGVGVKDLAIMQRGYSEAIGKSVTLTEEGYKAMAGMAEGTGLGKEFAVGMASEMDKFNISARQSGKIVETTMNIAGKMGVNGAAAMKSLQNNLKLAQRFNFKNSINGLAKLSIEATRLKLDLEGISSMADKVFRPEGAIEMAAQLTTMGGEFAKIGDPMQLMFKARNDFAGFSKDIGKASAEFVELNKVTGEYELKGGLAADRMREISQITGIAQDKLQEMAVAQKKINEAQGQLKGGIFKPEDAETIASLSEFDSKSGKWRVSVGGVYKDLKDLRDSDLKNIKAKEKSLEQRAKDARTFDETLQDLVLTFKQQLLPFAQQLKDGLGVPIQKMVSQWEKEGLFKTLKLFVKEAAELGLYLGKFILEGAKWLGPKGALATILGGTILFNAAKWIGNGMLLGKGFNMVASAGGGGGGLGDSFTDRGLLGKGGKTKLAKSLLPKLGKTGTKFAVGGIKALSGLASVGSGFAGDYAGGKLSEMSGYDDTAAGDVGSAIGGVVLGGLGSLLGPVGTMAGAALGSGLGKYIGDAFGSDKRENSSNLSRITTINDGIMFHPQDKFLKVNDSTMVAGTQAGGNAKVAEAINKQSSSNGVMIHKFEDMKINITVDIPGNEKLGTMLANTPEFIRRINEAINKEISMAAGGGKLSGGGPKKFK